MVAEQIQKMIELMILSLISNFGSIVVSAIVGFVSFQIAQLIKKLDPKTMQVFDWVITMAVQAAEQAGVAKLIENTAEAKKEWAIAEAKKLLEKFGLGFINVDSIAMAIEAAILKGLQNKPEENKQTVNIGKVEVAKEAA